MDNIFYIIIGILVVVGLLVIIGLAIYAIASIVPVVRTSPEIKAAYKQEALCKQRISMIQYSNDVLEFIRNFASEFVLIRYRTYQDNVYMEKITRTNLENFVRETAIALKEAIEDTHIDYDFLIYNEAYIESYIVNMCIVVTKELFERSVDDNEEIEVS